MTVGSLFSGIGGMDIGLEWAGMSVRWQCENDPELREFLRLRFGVPVYSDVRTLPDERPESVDLICGGAPCQPHSVAGKRLGAEDDRNLWPAMLGCVQAIGPRYVLFENVPGILPGYLETVCMDMGAAGYEVWPPLLFPAEAVGAPHLRYRVFVVAGQAMGDTEQHRLESPTNGNAGTVFATRGAGMPQPRVGGVPDGLPGGMDFPAFRGEAQKEWEPPRTVPPGQRGRRARLKGLGNAVVPQVAYMIGRALMETEA